MKMKDTANHQCPTCGQHITQDAAIRISAPDGISIFMRLKDVVDMQNEIVSLRHEIAQSRFNTIDHDEN